MTSRSSGFCGRPIRIRLPEVAKRHGVSERSIYGWPKRFSGMAADDVKELKNLTQENARLKKLLAERDLEIEILKEITAKKW